MRKRKYNVIIDSLKKFEIEDPRTEKYYRDINSEEEYIVDLVYIYNNERYINLSSLSDKRMISFYGSDESFYKRFEEFEEKA
jgi:hypothetical protein